MPGCSPSVEALATVVRRELGRELGGWMAVLACRIAELAAPRRSGGRQRRKDRARRRVRRDLGVRHPGLVGDGLAERRFAEAAAAHGIGCGGDVAESESDYHSAEEF